MITALKAFFGGPPPSYVTVDALLDPNVIIQLGVAPVRVDILSGFATITFRQAWMGRKDAVFGVVPAHYLGREHLIQEKLHFDRPQDRADVAALEAPMRAKHSTSKPSSGPTPKTARRTRRR